MPEIVIDGLVMMSEDEFAGVSRMVRFWNREEVLGSMNMSEGFMLANLFDSLDDHETADHIIREVWEGEADDCRDPEPWVNGHGSRVADLTEDQEANEGTEKFRFDPRRDWEEEGERIG